MKLHSSLFGRLALLLAVLFSSSAFAGEVEEPAGLPQLEIDYVRATDALEEGDAQGLFESGFDMYEENAKSLLGLRLAQDAFAKASAWFEVDGGKYNAQEDGSAVWAGLAKAHEEELKKARSAILLKRQKKSKTKKVDDTPVADWDGAMRTDVLIKVGEEIGAVPLAPRASAMVEVVSAKRAELKNKLEPDMQKILFGVIGGLGIFLLGMKYLSDGMQAAAGDGLRRLIGLATNNRFMAVGMGTLVTVLIQSSSITTVIVVGFVNSGLMMLHQAIGVIMGANIGTTITGWILVLKIGKFGLPLLGIGVLVHLLTRRERIRNLAMIVLGLGAVFYGLEMMKNGFKPLAGVPAFEETMHMFSAGTYFGVLKCAMIGCVMTIIVQSSSATLGITIGLASTGVIPFETAAALVLGENIGTTVTAFLASIGTTRTAKRAAYFHVTFNLIGALWITALFVPYMGLVGSFIESTTGTSPLQMDYASFGDKFAYASIVTTAIAATHTGFNVANTVLFIPLVGVFSRLLMRLVPGTDEDETPHLTHLDVGLVESPAIGIAQSGKEVEFMGEGVVKMMGWFRTVLTDEDEDREAERRIFKREEILDNIQKEVSTFLGDLLQGHVTHDVVDASRSHLRIADELESLSDDVASLMKMYRRFEKNKVALPEEEKAELLALNDRTTEYVVKIVEGLKAEDPEILRYAQPEGTEITRMMKECRRHHLERIEANAVNPLMSLTYMDMLNRYRLMKDLALNVAEVVGGEK